MRRVASCCALVYHCWREAFLGMHKCNIGLSEEEKGNNGGGETWVLLSANARRSFWSTEACGCWAAGLNTGFFRAG